MTGDGSEGQRDSGLFLAFEGVEGSGKSTQVVRLEARLRSHGVPCRAVREPGGTPGGERIRAVVLDPELQLAVRTELLLMLAARAQFVREVVRPALERGEVVLADRYELSTFAYQGLARGLGLERTRELNRFATGGLRPDATFLLLVDPETGRRRLEGTAPDRLEGEGRDFHARVDRAYRELADGEPGVVTVDGEADEDEVEARILREVASRWPRLLGEEGTGDPGRRGAGPDSEARAGPRK